MDVNSEFRNTVLPLMKLVRDLKTRLISAMAMLGRISHLHIGSLQDEGGFRQEVNKLHYAN